MMELFSPKVKYFRTCTGDDGINLLKGFIPSYDPFPLFKGVSSSILTNCIFKIASWKISISIFIALQDNSLRCDPYQRDAFENLCQSPDQE